MWDAAGLVQRGLFGADAGIIEARRNRVRVVDLAILVHQEERAVAVEHAGPAAGERRGVLFVDAVTGRFDAEDLDAGIIEERRKQPDRMEPPPMQAISESGRRPSV